MNVAVAKLEVDECAVRCAPRILRVGASVLLAGSFLATMAPRAVAQGCAMCYQNAASSGAEGRAALRHGIFILLLPALSLFLGIFFLIYRRRNPA